MRCSVQRGVLGAAGVHSGGGFRFDVTTMTSLVRRQTFLLGGRRPAASGNWVAKTLDKPELAYVDVKLLTFFLRRLLATTFYRRGGVVATVWRLVGGGRCRAGSSSVDCDMMDTLVESYRL